METPLFVHQDRIKKVSFYETYYEAEITDKYLISVMGPTVTRVAYKDIADIRLNPYRNISLLSRIFGGDSGGNLYVSPKNYRPSLSESGTVYRFDWYSETDNAQKKQIFDFLWQKSKAAA